MSIIMHDETPMRVLVGCEESGVVRDAFRARGHEAYSNDLKPSEDATYHLQMDVMDAIRQGPWDLIILHPECTYLALSGNRWYGRGTEGHHKRVEAVQWTARLWKLAKQNAPRVALENPTSVIFPILKREVDVQYIQPYEYGHKESKKTGFALHNLPRLQPTNILDVPAPGTQEHLDWQKVWRMAPSPERKKMRSRTYEGVAAAMAKQWGSLAEQEEESTGEAENAKLKAVSSTQPPFYGRNRGERATSKLLPPFHPKGKNPKDYKS